MAPLHLQSQKLPQKTKRLWKVGPQVLPAQIFHKSSPLFQQECLRQGLHCTLEAHESCTFCAGRLIAGKVIKTLQTWRYVWSFTNLWRLNVIKWAGEITNLYKKFNVEDQPVHSAGMAMARSCVMTQLVILPAHRTCPREPVFAVMGSTRIARSFFTEWITVHIRPLPGR